MHDEMVRLVERMMDLKKRYHDTEDARLHQQLGSAIKEDVLLSKDRKGMPYKGYMKLIYYKSI